MPLNDLPTPVDQAYERAIIEVATLLEYASSATERDLLTDATASLMTALGARMTRLETHDS